MVQQKLQNSNKKMKSNKKIEKRKERRKLGSGIISMLLESFAFPYFTPVNFRIKLGDIMV